jgi:hypothetical protein
LMPSATPLSGGQDSTVGLISLYTSLLPIQKKLRSPTGARY